eukprot:gene30560-20316_t
MRRGASSLVGAGRRVRSVLGMHPIPLCSGRGHEMIVSGNKEGVYSEGWKCAVCGRFREEGMVRWHCDACRDDLCLRCHHLKVDGVYPPGPLWEGSLSRFSSVAGCATVLDHEGRKFFAPAQVIRRRGAGFRGESGRVDCEAEEERKEEKGRDRDRDRDHEGGGRGKNDHDGGRAPEDREKGGEEEKEEEDEVIDADDEEEEEEEEGEEEEKPADQRKHELTKKLNRWRTKFMEEKGRAPKKKELKADPKYGPVYREWASLPKTSFFAPEPTLSAKEGKEVRMLMEQEGLGRFSEALVGEGYNDVRVLSEIGDDELSEVGMKKGHIKTLRRAIRKWIEMEAD